MNRVIVEKYTDCEYRFSMPDEVFNLMITIYGQSVSRDIENTYLYIYHHLPEDLKEKIIVTKSENTSGRRIYMGVDIENVMYDDRN